MLFKGNKWYYKRSYTWFFHICQELTLFYWSWNVEEQKEIAWEERLLHTIYLIKNNVYPIRTWPIMIMLLVTPWTPITERYIPRNHMWRGWLSHSQCEFCFDASTNLIRFHYAVFATFQAFLHTPPLMALLSKERIEMMLETMKSD